MKNAMYDLAFAQQRFDDCVNIGSRYCSYGLTIKAQAQIEQKNYKDAVVSSVRAIQEGGGAEAYLAMACAMFELEEDAAVVEHILKRALQLDEEITKLDLYMRYADQITFKAHMVLESRRLDVMGKY